MKTVYFSIAILLISVTNLIGQPMKKIYTNGKIYTVNANQPIAEAVVTLDNKIIFVGSDSEAKKYVDDKTEIIDLKNKLMLPGFIDNHTHFLYGGFHLNGIDLRGAKSSKEFIELLKNYVEKNKGKWITGGGWDHEAWDVKDYPKKEWLDSFSETTPIFVSRFDGHMGVANSYALKLAGINKDTPDPDGGLIIRDPKTGEPTGMLKDNAMSLVFNVVPEASDDEHYHALLTALEHAKELGLTSIQDITEVAHYRAFQRARREGKLDLRVYTRLPIYVYKNLVDAGIQYNFGDERLKIGSLKAFADGSLGSSTAWFFEKYDQDTNTFGLPMEIVTDGSLEKWALDADKNKLQISIHAIGDRANSAMLDMFEKIVKENPKWDRRFRIEHSQHVRFADVKRFRDLKVVASAQPYHLIDDGVWAEKRIGKERLAYTYPFRTMLDEGVLLCFGSDWTVAPLNPLLGIYAAVTRRTLDGKNPNGWIPEQKITIEEAIKCYTINNAYASFEEDLKGSIEVGKLADFVILNEDILTIAPEKIKDVEVLFTILDGKIIYKKK